MTVLDTAHAAFLRLRCSRGCDARGLVMADDRSGLLCWGCVVEATLGEVVPS